MPDGEVAGYVTSNVTSARDFCCEATARCNSSCQTLVDLRWPPSSLLAGRAEALPERSSPRDALPTTVLPHSTMRALNLRAESTSCAVIPHHRSSTQTRYIITMEDAEREGKTQMRDEEEQREMKWGDVVCWCRCFTCEVDEWCV